MRNNMPLVPEMSMGRPKPTPCALPRLLERPLSSCLLELSGVALTLLVSLVDNGLSAGVKSAVLSVSRICVSGDESVLKIEAGGIFCVSGIDSV